MWLSLVLATMSTSAEERKAMVLSANEQYIKQNKIVTVDHDKNTKLHYAAALNDLESAQDEIALGHKLDPPNSMGWTPLMMAVKNGNEQMMDLLLEHKANATKKNKFGLCVFVIAVTCGKLKIVEKLLEHLFSGGISRCIMERAMSPIAVAVMYGHQNILKFLIDRRFDINASHDITDVTPIMLAAAMGDNKLMKKLMRCGANGTCKNRLGQSAMDIISVMNLRNQSKTKSEPQLPFIVITPTSHQVYPVSPYPFPPFLRKSSGVFTPTDPAGVPNVSPIPILPQGQTQIFFPPDFSPSQYFSPLVHPSFLNAPFLQQESPMNQVFFAS